MFTCPPEIPSLLENALFEQLKSGVAIQEHALLKTLTQQGFKGFEPSLDALALFKAHFLCFHVLYRCQAKWFNEGLGWLEVYTLNIQLHPTLPTLQNSPTQKDALRDYYLNYQHFIDTQTADVQQLLDSFWRQFESSSLTHNHYAADLEALELDTNTPIESLSLTLINQQYRKLCARHHPDKGGKTADFQALSQAANRLRKLF